MTPDQPAPRSRARRLADLAVTVVIAVTALVAGLGCALALRPVLGAVPAVVVLTLIGGAVFWYARRRTEGRSS